MWLLDVKTIKLVFFQDDRQLVGKYAILSHTWEEEEVLFQEIHTTKARAKQGFRKLEYTCQQAIKDGLDYAWVDTCCINKESSAELSEAINSMWRWYWNSKICYAYLSDMVEPLEIGSESTSNLGHCRWFTRGWTLQELLAPPVVQFHNAEWQRIANRAFLSRDLEFITKVNAEVLRDRTKVFDYNVATRLSWAAYRKTTREEDEAYSLLGLFDVNMPLLYGEGSKAFVRLQEEIIHRYHDMSILTWQIWEPQQCGMLLSPRCYGFRGCEQLHYGARMGIDITNAGVKCGTRIKIDRDGGYLALLNCKDANGGWLYLRLRKVFDAAHTNGRAGFEIFRPLQDSVLGDLRDYPEKVLLLKYGVTPLVILEADLSLIISPHADSTKWTMYGREHHSIALKDARESTAVVLDCSTGESKCLAVSFRDAGYEPSLRWFEANRQGGAPKNNGWIGRYGYGSAIWELPGGDGKVIAEASNFRKQDDPHPDRSGEGVLISLKRMSRQFVKNGDHGEWSTWL